MCNPKPGTRCPSHAIEKAQKANEAVNAAFEAIRNPETPLNHGDRIVAVLELNEARKKQKLADDEYYIALASSSNPEHEQELHLSVDRIEADRYAGIADVRKAAAAKVNERSEEKKASIEFHVPLVDQTDEELDDSLEGLKYAQHGMNNLLIERINNEQPYENVLEKSAEYKASRELIEAEKERRVQAAQNAEVTATMATSENDFSRYATTPVEEYGNLICEVMNAKFPVENSWDNPFEVRRGRRYDKVVRSGGVVLFVDKQNNGAIMKPAGWNAPATGVRVAPRNGEELAHVLQERADRFGSWLYVRR